MLIVKISPKTTMSKVFSKKNAFLLNVCRYSTIPLFYASKPVIVKGNSARSGTGISGNGGIHYETDCYSLHGKEEK